MVPRPCPGCGGTETTTLLDPTAEEFCSSNSTYVRDFDLVLGIARDDRFPVVRCDRCGFVFALLLPPDAFLGLVYDAVTDPERGPFESSSPAWVAHQLWLGSLLLAELARTFPSESRLRVLDYGCGHGTLVRALSGPRVECLGYEPSARRVAWLAAMGVAATDRPTGPFHGVILSDVLEHVPDPRATLRECGALLAPGGRAVINVPNCGAARIARLRQTGCGRDRNLNPWEHLNYFSPESLRRLVADAGLAVEETHPDVGLRSGLDGVRKWGNAVRSTGRLVRYALGGRRSTCLFAVAAP